MISWNIPNVSILSLFLTLALPYCCCANLTASELQEEVDNEPSVFAYYNCTSTEIYHAESDGNMCFCRSVYDMREFNISDWDLDIFAEYRLDELEPYLLQIKPFSAYVDYVSCKFAHGPCECPFTKSAVQVADSQYGVADSQWAYQGCTGVLIFDHITNEHHIECTCSFSYNHSYYVETGIKEFRIKSVPYHSCHRSAYCDCGGAKDKAAEPTTPISDGQTLGDSTAFILLFLLQLLSICL